MPCILKVTGQQNLIRKIHQDKVFHLQTGTDKNVKMMYNNDDYAAVKSDKYLAAKLPYGNGQFEMTILLPKEGTSITDLLNSFTTAEWNKIQSTTGKQKCNVGLPRFTLNYTIQLNKTLSRYGA